ncbi:MAG: alpha/beta fold hydrolase [Dehalococcoidia bacterium]|nr:alpha/beta fold hydrolase [Dehalococcoidia bacterium]
MPELTLDDAAILHYEEWGDTEAPAVVLLHGFTSDLRMWKAHAEALSEEYRVIAVDLRGHGASGAPEDLDTYTMERYAEDVRQLLAALGVDLCALVGCSFGGMVALQVAVTWPDMIAALVLTDTSPAYASERYDEEFRRREARITEQERIVEQFGTAELGKRVAATVKDTFLADALRRRYSSMTRAGYLGSARVRRERPDLIGRLAGLTMPTLICTGDSDPVRSAADVMLLEMPGARFVLFKECGHGVPSLRPEAFLQVLTGFLHDVEDGRPLAGTVSV